MDGFAPAEVLIRSSTGQTEALTPWDDYAIHQQPALVTSVTPALPGWAERFYFNVLRPTGELAAIMGGGVYPLRGVRECYFCRIDGDRQVNVRAVVMVVREPVNH